MAAPKKRRSVQDFPGFGSFSLLFYIYLYAPILVLILYSFNAGNSATIWEGFSFAWYKVAFTNPALRSAAFNSLMIALCSSLIATVIATLAALATSRGAKFKGLKLSMGMIMLPLVLPEIVIGVATLALFASLGLALGYGNLIIAHTVFCIPFAFLPIRARLNDMDLSLEQAAADLYAGPFRTFYKVTLPLLLPGIMSGLMLAFIVSMDNFVISMMVSQAGTTTLPIFIFGLLRMGLSPDVNAISTLIIVVSVIFVSLSWMIGNRKN